jgi:hypothetical protein
MKRYVLNLPTGTKTPLAPSASAIPMAPATRARPISPKRKKLARLAWGSIAVAGAAGAINGLLSEPEPAHFSYVEMPGSTVKPAETPTEPLVLVDANDAVSAVRWEGSEWNVVFRNIALSEAVQMLALATHARLHGTEMIGSNLVTLTWGGAT